MAENRGAPADEAILPVPAAVQAHLNRGLALKGARRLGEALAAFEQALALQPECIPALVNHAALLSQLGRSQEALESSDRAIALRPDFVPALCNRGLALSGLDRPLDALASFDQALAIDPNFVAALGNRGKALQALNRPLEALAAYDRVIALQPEAAQAYLNASHTHLSLGQYEQGWALYEWRKKLPAPLGNRQFRQPLWLGAADIRGKKILLHWEQGLGDTIQFCRYAELVRARGAQVFLMVQGNLRTLLRTLKAEAQIVSDEQVPGDLDYHCPLLSLPLAFGTRVESVPANMPYLFPEPGRVARWRERIGGTGFKIGINWQGNKQSPADRGRSFPLNAIRCLSAVPGVRLISLQKGAGAEQMQSLPEGMMVEDLGVEFDRGPDAFLDSAAVMECLDLIITSDTAIAHLAGALARPAWVALQHVADWRWLTNRADCPWYPSLRLFRQKTPGRWDELFGAMRAELPALRESPS